MKVLYWSNFCKVLLGVILCILITSCYSEIQPPKAQEIFEKYKSGVVLISTSYYYEVDIEDLPKIWYYSPSENIFTPQKEEILKNLSHSTGTGFIISDNGEIITNNHVVNPDGKEYKYNIREKFFDNQTVVLEAIKKYADTIVTTYNYLKNNYSYLSERERDILIDKHNECVDNRKLLEMLYNKLDNIDVERSVFTLKLHHLGIAFNDTHITELDDLQECVVVKTSDNEKVDLALIQTKTKNFNIKPSNTFNFEDNNPNLNNQPNLLQKWFSGAEKTKQRDIKNPIKVNEDVYMIGYNKGFALAKTKQGIKSQFTTGKISQENDSEKILYTIPTLEGSSGSPIVDKWGNLVAVNFAKISNSQNFSFGVPVNEVKKFYIQK